jgi:uncharacterized protein with PIN domain
MTARRFAVDKMLGRLATWLRLIGADATYGPHLSGKTLIRHARSEARTVLTRDRRLLPVAPPPEIAFIHSDHFREQLREVVAAFPLGPDARPFSRCARCNEPLVPVAGAAVAARVPAYVLATQHDFARCPECQRVYWPATHHQHILDELRRLGLAPSSRDDRASNA